MSTHALTELQLGILRILWDRGEASAADVREALARDGRKLAPSTVATLLSRLEGKGVVAHRTDGPKYIYRADTTESEVRRSIVSEFTERGAQLFRGDTVALVIRLLAEADVDPGDLARLKEVIERKAGDPQPPRVPAEPAGDAPDPPEGPSDER